jgi:hypothetical protein
MEKSFNNKKIVFYSLIFFLFGSISIAQPQKKTSNIYKDVKNGYFSILLPDKWKIEEYQDVRTKVSFSHPTDSTIFMRFIVRDASGETFSNVKSTAEDSVKGWKSEGIKCELKTSEYLGQPAVAAIVDNWKGQGAFELIKFISGGLHFNIQLAANSKEKLIIHRDEMINSINTITLLKGWKPNSEKAKIQKTANVIRMSDLFYQSNQKADACNLLKDALTEDPESFEIKNQIEKFNCK